MTPETLREIRRIFDAAKLLPASERAAFVERQAAGPDLQRHVETLLAAHDGAAATVVPVGDRPNPAHGEPGGSEHGGSESLAAGTLIAGRFHIRSFIAAGGMGEVYAAEDGELKAMVALKAIREDRLADPLSIARLRREIALARRVSSPNVCRMHDLVRHDRPGRPPTYFLSMELLEGETLTARLLRSPRLAADEALPIASQVLAALAAAHSAGVVHRDLKPDNIMLLATPGSSEPRVVVTDFGIASEADAGTRPDAKLTATGGVIGTLAYMSPEQVLSGTISPATDLHAFGLILFEMMTGRLPFERADGPQALLRHFVEKAPRARTIIPTLDPRWDDAIAWCLEREPDKRPRRAEDVLAALTGTPVRMTRLLRRPALAITLLALALALIGTLAITVMQRRQERPLVVAREPTAPPQRIAMPPLVTAGAGAGSEWLATAITELVAGQLQASNQVRLVPVERAARAFEEAGVSGTKRLPSADLKRMAERLGADILLLGSVEASGKGEFDPVRIELRVEDARTGRQLGLLQELAPASEMFDLADRLSVRLIDMLGIHRPSAPASSLGVLPTRLDATRAYAEALTHLRSFRIPEARLALERAVAADPTFALAHAALSDAWMELGYEEKARREALSAVNHAAALPEAERLLVEARYQATRGDRPAVVTALTRVVALRPDDIEARLRLISAYSNARDYEGAFRTLDTLRADFPYLAEDGRVDLAEALAAFDATDLPRQEAAARRAVQRATAREERYLRAEATVWLANAHFRQGRYAEAGAAYTQAKDLYGLAGDRVRMADALRWWGHSVPGAAGRLAESRAAQEEGLRVYREAGSRRREAQALNAIANIDFYAGDLEAAERHFTEALGIYREVGWIGADAWIIGSLGGIRFLQGRLDEARGLIQDAVATLRDQGTPLAVTTFTSGLGRILFEQDRLPEAAALYEEALSAQGSVATAAEFDAELKLNRAELALEHDRAAEALAEADGVVARALERGQHRELIFGECVRSRCLLALGRMREARDASDHAWAAAEPMEEIEPRLRALSARAIAHGEHSTPDDIQRLRDALAVTRAKGLVMLELEVGLALAIVEHALGDDIAAARSLDEVERAASEHGLARLERAAKTARAGLSLAP